MEVWEVGVRAVAAAVIERVGDVSDLPERWLCFASGPERRRLTDYPPRWPTMSPGELDALCRAAAPSDAWCRPAAPVAVLPQLLPQRPPAE